RLASLTVQFGDDPLGTSGAVVERSTVSSGPSQLSRGASSLLGSGETSESGGVDAELMGDGVYGKRRRNSSKKLSSNVIRPPGWNSAFCGSTCAKRRFPSGVRSKLPVPISSAADITMRACPHRRALPGKNRPSRSFQSSTINSPSDVTKKILRLCRDQ